MAVVGGAAGAAFAVSLAQRTGGGADELVAGGQPVDIGSRGACRGMQLAQADAAAGEAVHPR